MEKPRGGNGGVYVNRGSVKRSLGDYGKGKDYVKQVQGYSTEVV